MSWIYNMVIEFTSRFLAHQSCKYVDHGILLTYARKHSICCPTLCSYKATSPNSPRNPYSIITKEIPRFNKGIALRSKIGRLMQYHWGLARYLTQVYNLYTISIQVRLPGVEPGSIAWKAIILTVGRQWALANSSCKSCLLPNDKTFQIGLSSLAIW